MSTRLIEECFALEELEEHASTIPVFWIVRDYVPDDILSKIGPGKIIRLRKPIMEVHQWPTMQQKN